MVNLNAGQMKRLSSKEMVTATDMPRTGKVDFCEAFAEGKPHRAPFKLVKEIQWKKKIGACSQ